MTGNEWLRFCVIIVGGINLGLIAAVFAKVGRYFVPHIAMRAVMAGGALIALCLVLSSIVRFQTPTTWVLYGMFTGLLLKTCGLGMLFRWYGTEAGQHHIKTMLASVRHQNGRRTK